MGPWRKPTPIVRQLSKETTKGTLKFGRLETKRNAYLCLTSFIRGQATNRDSPPNNKCRVLEGIHQTQHFLCLRRSVFPHPRLRSSAGPSSRPWPGLGFRLGREAGDILPRKENDWRSETSYLFFPRTLLIHTGHWGQVRNLLFAMCSVTRSRGKMPIHFLVCALSRKTRPHTLVLSMAQSRNGL